MTTYRSPATDGLEFGYVCSARFLTDVRADSDTLPVFKVPDRENILGFAAYRESTRKPNRLVVTPGDVVDRALVVSDSCAVEAALGRGEARARGRIWFAPLRKLETDGQRQEVEDTPDVFGRFLLRPDDTEKDYWAVELQRAFPANAAAVRRALEADRKSFLLCRLDAEVADEARARWAAFSVRSGPLVAQDNVNHLIDRLEARGIPTVDAESATAALAAVAAAAWVFEGSSLEAAGALREEHAAGLLDAAIEGITDDLRALSARVTAALEALASIRIRLQRP